MIITSLLDTDLYNLTQHQFVYCNYPDTNVEYAFKCRNRTDFLNLVGDIGREIKFNLHGMGFEAEEIEYLRSLGYFSDKYLIYLETFTIDAELVSFKNDAGKLSINISGKWADTILFEVLILSIVNEIYFRESGYYVDEGIVRLNRKMVLINKYQLPLIEFGSRRRFSAKWHEFILYTLKNNCPSLVGTSNVKLAMDVGLKPIGTMSHQLLQAYQAFVHPADAQRKCLEEWIGFYGGKLGIALTDVVGYRNFLKDFDYSLASVYSGVRHDSGDPYEWAGAMIEHYKTLGIDPKEKTLVFSDGLDVPKAVDIYNTFRGKTKMNFGIGTNLTNDVGYEPLQIVIKMVSCQGRPVAKLSDSPGKEMCNSRKYVNYLKELFEM